MKATEIVRTGPGRYCLPPDRQNRRKDRTRKTQQPILPVCPGVVERELPKEPLKIKNKKPICPVFPTCLGAMSESKENLRECRALTGVMVGARHQCRRHSVRLLCHADLDAGAPTVRRGDAWF